MIVFRFWFLVESFRPLEKVTRNQKRLPMEAHFSFTAVFEPAEEGGFIGYVAEIPGVNTQGETLEETRENLLDALEMILAVRREQSRAQQVAGAIQEAIRLAA